MGKSLDLATTRCELSVVSRRKTQVPVEGDEGMIARMIGRVRDWGVEANRSIELLQCIFTESRL